MSLPTSSDLDGYQNNGGIYANTNSKNDVIILNIKGNGQLNSEKSTEYNETEANLQLNNIYNNKIFQKSVIQKPSQIIYYDNVKENQFPVSENLRNQLSSTDKDLNPVNNINNKIIKEVNIHQNNNLQNYNMIRVNTDNSLTNINGTLDNNNISFQNGVDLKEDKKPNKTCGQKAWNIIKIILLVILILPLFVLCICALAYGGGGIPISDGSSNGICDCCNCEKKEEKETIRKI